MTNARRGCTVKKVLPYISSFDTTDSSLHPLPRTKGTNPLQVMHSQLAETPSFSVFSFFPAKRTIKGYTFRMEVPSNPAATKQPTVAGPELTLLLGLFSDRYRLRNSSRNTRKAFTAMVRGNVSREHSWSMTDRATCSKWSVRSLYRRHNRPSWQRKQACAHLKKKGNN